MSCDASRDKAARAAQASGISRLASKTAGCAVEQRPGCVQTVDDVDWERRTVIGRGGFALVYRVTPEVVAKVGDIQPAEAEAQQHFARQGLALPVLNYQEEVELPAEVSREACPIHGKRVDILPEEGYVCTCGRAVAVLLMPLADDLDGVSQEELQTFMMGFSRDCEEQLGLCWDARPRHVARYAGRLVALDFGEEI
jgi:hypothetical protein